MTRRKLIGVLAPGLLVLLAAGAFVAWPRSDRISATNFHRLRVGMSKAEVETILGPAGDHRTGDTTLSSASYRPETMGTSCGYCPRPSRVRSGRARSGPSW
jgi:hypothetical protein